MYTTALSPKRTCSTIVERKVKLCTSTVTKTILFCRFLLVCRLTRVLLKIFYSITPTDFVFSFFPLELKFRSLDFVNSSSFFSLKLDQSFQRLLISVSKFCFETLRIIYSLTFCVVFQTFRSPKQDDNRVRIRFKLEALWTVNPKLIIYRTS